ncbi:aldo/keto reductase [Biostraticola tofi]|uniref:Aryl-alcohol dehydrogenase-like predicted oxidoreductase n=1 Tax=Biostraticola tofi TaxID=466109 RepID=A0A4V2W3G7_9GAMM|nr:aldo/keto reductase [Biostraticola tofi]TCV91929.1 aryl-alcohol dehydrogenase-like predicted oxidoreductase [Biostraticola tofi]
METRILGRSGIEVPKLTFGGNVFGWTVDEAQSFTLLDSLVERQLNFIDTADVYSAWVEGNQGGESETIIGNWLKRSGKRDRIILATKVGKPMGDDRKGLSASYITQAVEASLRRLQTDYIDLYQSHDDDQSVSLEETLSAFDSLIQQGKVRVIGASNYSGPRFAEALRISEQNGLARYETLQPEYNLYDRQAYEEQLEPVVAAHGVGVINYYALASGFLSGKYRAREDAGKSKRGQSVVDRYLNDRGTAILNALDAVSEEHRVTPAQVALAWQMKRPSITAPIASATSVEQLDDLYNATQLTLSDQDYQTLAEASAW